MECVAGDGAGRPGGLWCGVIGAHVRACVFSYGWCGGCDCGLSVDGLATREDAEGAVSGFREFVLSGVFIFGRSRGVMG